MSKYQILSAILLVIFIWCLVIYIETLENKLEAKDTEIEKLNNQIAIEIEKQEILQDELYEMRLTMEWYIKNK